MNINVINNSEKELNVTVNKNGDNVEIIVNAVNNFKLSKDLKPGDILRDIDGDEYILLYYLENGDAAILRKDNLTEMKFSESNNNYNGSNIDKYLCEKYLPELERKFGSDNIAEHEVDLLSMDGEDDYGIIKRKVSILTLDCYRINKKVIKKHIKKMFWLSTSHSTPNGCGSGCVLCVGAGGDVDCGRYDDVLGVRPFAILKSSIFVF